MRFEDLRPRAVPPTGFRRGVVRGPGGPAGLARPRRVPPTGFFREVLQGPFRPGGETAAMKRLLIALLILCGPDPVLAEPLAESLLLAAARPGLLLRRRSPASQASEPVP